MNNKNVGIFIICLHFIFGINLFSQNKDIKIACQKNSKNNLISLTLVSKTKYLFSEKIQIDTTYIYIDALKKFTYLKSGKNEYIKIKDKISKRDSNNIFLTNNTCKFPLQSPEIEFINFYTGNIDSYKSFLLDCNETKKGDTLILNKYLRQYAQDTNLRNITTVTTYNQNHQLIKLFFSIHMFNDSQVNYVNLIDLSYKENKNLFNLSRGIKSPKVPVNKLPIVANLKPSDTLFSNINTFTTIDSNKIALNSEKLYLFDFWYMSCYPCIKSFPEIDKLINYDSLANKIQVISANCKDKKTEKLNSFISYHKIRSPIISVYNYEFLDKFKSFPTFVITDYKGIVLYVHIGYSPELFNILKNKCISLIYK